MAGGLEVSVEVGKEYRYLDDFVTVLEIQGGEVAVIETCFGSRAVVPVDELMEKKSMSNKITACKITRPDCSGWMFAGTTSAEVANTVQAEIESNLAEGAGSFGDIHIEEYRTTQEEIDYMPEFEGW